MTKVPGEREPASVKLVGVAGAKPLLYCSLAKWKSALDSCGESILENMKTFQTTDCEAKPTKKMLSLAQRNQVISRAQAGADPRQLALDYGITIRRVHQLAEQSVTDPYRHMASHDEQEAIVEAAERGLHPKEIAANVGFSRRTVETILADRKAVSRGGCK